MAECNSAWLRENWFFVYLWVAFSIHMVPILVYAAYAIVWQFGLTLLKQENKKKLWYFSNATVAALAHLYIAYAFHVFPKQCSQLSVRFWGVIDVDLDYSAMLFYKWITLIIALIVLPLTTWKFYRSGQWLMSPSEFRQSVKGKKWWRW